MEEVTLSASCRNKVAPTGRLRTIEMDSFSVVEARVQGLGVGGAGSSRRLSGSPPLTPPAAWLQSVCTWPSLPVFPTMNVSGSVGPLLKIPVLLA